MRIKKFFIYLLLLQLIVVAIPTNTTAVYAYEQEYELIKIENPGFELVNKDGTFPGWTSTIIGEDDGLQTEALAENASEYVKSGNQSVKLVDHSPKKGMAFKSNKISIKGGNYYRLKTSVFAEEKSVRIYIKFFNENGIEIPGSDANILANTPKVWKSEQLEAYAPPEASFAEIWFYKSNAGQGTVIYIDDVEFSKKVEMNTEELDVPYNDNPVNLGETVNIGLSQAAMFAEGKDGRLYHYITSSGTPSAFTVVDALTGEQIYTERVSGAGDTIWGIDQGKDGNIYFAASGKLFRYLVDEKKVEIVGTNPTGNTTMYDIKASSDGKIYGSTFHSTNQGKVFEYNIETDEFKDLGIIKEGQNYARGLGVTDKYIYIGVGEYSHLMKYDRETEQITEINIPEESGTKRMLSQIEIVSGKLFVYAGDRVHILNEDDESYIRTITFQNRISPASSTNADKVYFKDGERFYYYDLKKDIIGEVTSINQPLPDTEFKAHQWLTPKKGEFAGKEVLFSMAAYGETLLFEPISGDFSTHIAKLPTIGTPINTLEYKDGLLFMGGFQRGMSIYDTAKEKLIHEYPTFHQAESIGFLGDSIYFGTYTGAKMYRMDLTNEIDYNQFGWGNPGLALQISNQNRPYVMEAGNDKLYIGTFPSGGTFEGALTIIEEVKDNATGKVIDVKSKTFPNIADNRIIIGMAYHKGNLFGSTTVYSGSGSINPPPLQDNATIFKFNTDTEEIEKSFVPKIKGIEGNIQIIGDLSVGPDGLIWGILDSFVDSISGYQAAIFAMNPDTMEIVKSKVITNSPYSTSKYRPYHIRWGKDSVMYTTIGRQLIAIDSETLDSKKMLPGKTVNLMTMSDNGDIFYVGNSELYKLPILKDNSELTIIDIAKLKDIHVSYGTQIEDLKFPKKIQSKLSDGTNIEVPVIWNMNNSDYNSKTAGIYKFSGKLSLSLTENVMISENDLVEINVVVNEEDKPDIPEEPGKPGKPGESDGTDDTEGSDESTEPNYSKLFPSEKGFTVNLKSNSIMIKLNKSNNNESVELSKEQIRVLNEKGLRFIIEQGNITLSIPPKTFNITDGTVKVNVNELPHEKAAVSSTFDITITHDGKEISKFPKGITLMFHVDSKDVNNTNNLKVFYFNEKTKLWEIVGGTYHDRIVTATTNHLSTFTVFNTDEDNLSNGTNGADETAPTDGEEIPITATSQYNMLTIGLLIMLIGVSVYFVKRRRTHA